MTTISRLFAGETVVCIGTGPSLTQADVDACRGLARVIVINNAFKLALWADAMFACDQKFWNWEKGAPSFTGLKYTLDRPLVPKPKLWPGVESLKDLGRTGLSLDPTGVKTGHDSGYQSINLAVLLGASKIVLLGYDMQAGKTDHFFGSHPDHSKPPFSRCLDAYKTLVEPLKSVGVEIVNCTPGSALRCFPMASLQETLIRRAA